MESSHEIVLSSLSSNYKNSFSSSMLILSYYIFLFCSLILIFNWISFDNYILKDFFSVFFKVKLKKLLKDDILFV